MTPGLWSSIQKALDGSDWFVLLASPEAAGSPWVNREIEHWVATKPVDRILPVLTDGVWEWDAERRDFSDGSSAVPAALRGVFDEEPLYLDLRWARDDLQLSLRHSRFRDAIAQLAAPMHGVSKDDLEGEDVRQHRRVRRLLSVAVASLMVLSVAASVAGVFAVRNAQDAAAAALEAGRQQQVAAEQRGSALRFEGEARRQEEVARRQEARAGAAAAETVRQEKLAAQQKDVAARASGEAARQQENARRQQGIADAAAVRTREQERVARQQRDAAQRSSVETARQKKIAQEERDAAQRSSVETVRQKQIAQEQQRLAEESATVARRQEQIAREQQRLAQQAAEEALRQEQIAKDKQRLAEQATEEARKQKANAEQQQRIAIGRRLTNQAKAIIKDDPRTAVRLGVAAARVQADEEARRQLAGLVTSTRYAGALDEVKDVAYGADNVLVTQDPENKLTLHDVADRANPTRLADLGVYATWAISPDGQTVAAYEPGQPVAVLLDLTKPSDPKRVAEIPVSSRVFNLTFSQNGRTLLVGAFDKATRDVADLWDVAERGKPKRLATRFDGSNSVKKATFSPDGRTLVTALEGSSTAVWDLTTPTRAKSVATLAEPLGSEQLHAMAFLRDAPFLVTGGEDHTLLIDLSTPAAPKRTLAMPNDGGGTVTSVIVDSAGRRLVTGSQGGVVNVFDLVGTDADPSLRRVDSVRAPDLILGTALSPDGRTVITTDWDAIATQWNVAAYGAPQWRGDLTGHGEQGLAAAFAPDGRSMLTVGSKAQATVWDVTGPAPVRRAPATVHDREVHFAAATPDGRFLAAGDLDGRVTVSDVTNPAQPVTVGKLAEEDTWSGRYDELVISPDGRTLALGNRVGSVVLWDVTRGRPATRLGPLVGSEMPLAFSPDGKTFAVKDSKGPAASLWTLDGPAGPSRRGELGRIKSTMMQTIAFSPNGETVALAEGSEAGLWDVSQDRPQQFSKFTNPGWVNSIAFSRDGRTFAAVESTQATLWDFADRTDPVQLLTLPLIAQSDWASRVTATFGEDRLLLATGEDQFVGTEGNATLWDLRMLAELRADPSVRACAMTGGLSEDQWARYVPELPYRTTCPG